MDAAVDAVVARIGRKSSATALPPQGLTPYSMSDSDYRGSIVEISDEGIGCTKAICNYIYGTYGRFPGTVDTKAGAYGRTHATHMATGHS